MIMVFCMGHRRHSYIHTQAPASIQALAMTLFDAWIKTRFADGIIYLPRKFQLFSRCTPPHTLALQKRHANSFKLLTQAVSRALLLHIRGLLG